MRVADPDQQAEQRERILDAAIKAFARHGFHKASMTDIAAAAEMSAGNLYRYFTSKEFDHPFPGRARAPRGPHDARRARSGP